MHNGLLGVPINLRDEVITDHSKKALENLWSWIGS